MIAVATLLVAVVGATFAYFTATTTSSNKETSQATVKTKELGNTTFALTGSEVGNKLDYPGGIAVIEAEVKANKDSSDNNKYKFSYKFKVDAENYTQTALTWTLYKASSSSLKGSLDLTGCHLVAENGVESEQGKTVYYYSTLESGDSEGTNSCKKGMLSALSSAVANGTIAASTDGEQAGTASATLDTGLSDTVEVTSEEGATQYYYLVIEYPNDGTDQTAKDKGKQITAKLALAEDVVATPIDGA